MIHVLGSCLLAIYLNLFLNVYLSLEIAFIMGLTWEICDQLQKKEILNWKYFDPSGFDIYDLLRDIFGIILSLPILFK